MEDIIYPKWSVGYLREWQKRNNIEVDIYKEGTLLYVKEIFDSYLTTLSIEAVSICKDKDFIESFCGEQGKKQNPYVINCIEFIGSEMFTNKFIYDKKDVKVGDKVYVAITGDGDPYGDFILGVFTERPDKEFIIRKYIEQHNSLLPEDDEFNRESEDYDDGDWVFEVVEMIIS